MKSCGIHDISDPILSGLLSKYGATEGFKIYAKAKKELGLSDKTIRHQYLPESIDNQPVKQNTKLRAPNTVRSFNTTTAAIESQFGLNKFSSKEGQNSYYKAFKDKKTADKKAADVQLELSKKGLNGTYAVRKFNTPDGYIVKVLPIYQDSNLEPVSRLIPEASAPLVKAEQDRLKNLNQEKRALQTELERTTVIDTDYFKKAQRVDTINKALKESNAELRRLKELDTVDKLFKKADEDYLWLQDFFSKPDYTYQDLQQALTKYETWAISAVSPGSPHPYLDSLEQKNAAIVDRMNAISTKVASRFGTIMSTRIQEAVIASTRKHSNVDKLTDQEILDTLVEEDASSLAAVRAYTLNLGKQQPLVLKALFNNINKANNAAHNAAFDRIKKLKDAAKNIRLKDMRMYYQKDDQGRLTGKLLEPAKAEFISRIQELQRNIDYATIEKNALDPDSKDGKQAFRRLVQALEDKTKFYLANVEPIEIGAFVADLSTFQVTLGLPSDLFVVNPDIDPAGIRTRLEKRFGKAEANRMLRRAKSMANSFVAERDSIIAEMLGYQGSKGQPTDKLSEDNLNILREWVNQNSPFKAYTLIMQGAIGATTRPNFKYTLAVPTKANEDLDYQYLAQSYPEALEFYDIMVDIFEEGRADIGDVSGYLTGLSIPLMQDAFFKEMFKGGKLLPKLLDSAKYAISAADNESYQQKDLHKDIDNIVNQDQINMNAVTMHGIQKQVKEELLRLEQEFIAENGEDALTKDIKAELRKNAIDNVYTNSSSNLVGIMSLLSLNIETIKAKRAIEPQVQLVKRFMKDGNLLNGRFDQKNAIKAMDYFLDREFFGSRPADNVGKGGIKVLSVKDKESQSAVLEKINNNDARIEALEEKENSGEILSQPELDELEQLRKEQESLEKDLEKLGRKVKGSKVLDGLISVTQLIGIGFSPISAIGNVGIGYVSNQMLAADGRDLSADSLARAYSYILGGNTARFFTFGLSQRVIGSNHADKIRNLVDSNQLVASIFDEINHNTSKLTGKDKGMLRSSHLMERSEFVNQAAILVGMMLETEVTLSNGTTTNLYDAYNEEGNLQDDIVSYKTKSGSSKTWDPNEFFQYVKHIVEETHGDYNHSVLLKATAGGRLLSTFRTWMFRTAATRYAPEEYDSISGYVRKGRYLSAMPLPFINNIPIIGKFLPPVVLAGAGIDHPAVGSLIPPSARKRLGLPEPSRGTKELVDTLGKVFKNSTGVYGDFFKSILTPHKYKSKFKERLEQRGFSEVDTANISAVFTEFFVKIQLALSMILLYSMYDEEDDDARNNAIILAMNLSRRFEKDLNFYTDFTETGRTLDNPIAAMRIFDNFSQMSDAVSRTFDGRDPYLQSGFYEGWWAPTKIAFRSLPGLTAIDQARRYMNIDVMTGNNITDKEDLYRAFEKDLIIKKGESD